MNINRKEECNMTHHHDHDHDHEGHEHITLVDDQGN